MAKGISFQQVGKLLSKAASKGSVVTALTSEALDVGKTISKEKFGYDFFGLAIKLSLFYALAFIIEWYMKAKIAVDKVAKDPDTPIAVVSGLFGLAGILFNSLFKLFKEQQEQAPTPPTESIFSNEILQALFSEAGYKGIKYWDIIKAIALLLVIAEWKSFSDVTKATGGKVQPMTHGMFLLFVFAIGLTLIPDLLKRFKVTDFNLEQFR